MNVRSDAADAAATTIRVLPEIQYQVFQGFGQGSMHQQDPKWRALYDQATLDRLLDWLYTLEDGGLGMNICRFHMPVGDAPGHAHMFRRPYGTQSPRGLEPEDGRLQLDGHEGILWHARGAAERGATMVGFWNSPPYWLTVSGCTMGGGDGTANNMRAGEEARFARHMGEVLDGFRDTWGIEFDYVCPINEPETNYWNANSGQEGCHTDMEQAVILFKALAKELRARNLKSVIQGPEAGYSSSVEYLDRLMANPEIAKLMPIVTCHQYAVNAWSMRKWAVRARALGKTLWMSEWGDWTHLGPEPETQLQQAGINAGKIHEGLNVMQAEAWCMWEPGFLIDTNDDGPVRRKAFWAVAQYTRFIRPGMRRVEAAGRGLRTTAWMDEKARRLVLVILNPRRTAVEADVDLSSFEGITVLEANRTSGEEDLAEIAAPRIENGRMRCALPPKAVLSVALRYEKVRPALVRNGGFETGALGPWSVEADDPKVAGVQESNPSGGVYNGFIDPTAENGGRIVQQVAGLEPGARYRLTASCAAKQLTARLVVLTGKRRETTDVQGSGYRQYTIEFKAAKDGSATIAYEADATPHTGEEHPWATIDNVFLTQVQGD